jgi:hypothetical protein
MIEDLWGLPRRVLVTHFTGRHMIHALSGIGRAPYLPDPSSRWLLWRINVGREQVIGMGKEERNPRKYILADA